MTFKTEILDNIVNYICRYYFGIIDIFTTYGWRQRLAQFVKSLRYCGGDHSSLQSDLYASRFVNFIENHVV